MTTWDWLTILKYVKPMQKRQQNMELPTLWEHV